MEPTVVLVVEPDADTRAMLGMLLEAEGYRAVLTPSHAEAAAAAQQERPRVVLAVPPGDRGAPLDADSLRDLTLLGHGAPVVLCSGRTGIGDLDPGPHGLFAVLPKPLDVELLLRTVGDALGADAGGRAATDSSPNGRPG